MLAAPVAALLLCGLVGQKLEPICWRNKAQHSGAVPRPGEVAAVVNSAAGHIEVCDALNLPVLISGG